MTDPLHEVDLAEATRQHADPPPFDGLVARARRARRRARIAGAATLALVGAVLGGSAWLADDTGRTGPDPVEAPSVPRSEEPSPPPAEESASKAAKVAARLRALTAEQIIATGDLDDIVWTESGRSLSTWRVCNDQFSRCQYAWQVAGMAFGKLKDNRRASPLAAGDRLFLRMPNGSMTLVDPERGLRRVEIGDPPLPVEPGHVAVDADGGYNVLDPASAQAWYLVPPQDARFIGAAEIDDVGRVWTIAGREGGKANNVGVYWRDGGTWSWEPLWDHELASAGSVEVAGDRVFAWSAGDGQTIPRPTAVAVTTDGGSSWTHPDPDSLPFETVMSMVTAGETLFVMEADGARIWRNSDPTWTSFEQVRGATAPYGLEAAGESVYAVQDDDTALRSDDGGVTWETLDLR